MPPPVRISFRLLACQCRGASLLGLFFGLLRHFASGRLVGVFVFLAGPGLGDFLLGSTLHEGLLFLLVLVGRLRVRLGTEIQGASTLPNTSFGTGSLARASGASARTADTHAIRNILMTGPSLCFLGEAIDYYSRIAAGIPPGKRTKLPASVAGSSEVEVLASTPLTGWRSRSGCRFADCPSPCR